MMIDWLGERWLSCNDGLRCGTGVGLAADIIGVPGVARKAGNRCAVLLDLTKRRADAAFQDAELPVMALKEAQKLVRAPSELLCAAESDKTFVTAKNSSQPFQM